MYLAILVLLTQRLALSRDLRTRQTLTAIHDKNSAWLGIGSAGIGLWEQAKLLSAISGISGIALYLFGIYVLHVTIPALVHVSAYNTTVPTIHVTNISRAEYGYKYELSIQIAY